jgi:hypothetical protein
MAEFAATENQIVLSARIQGGAGGRVRAFRATRLRVFPAPGRIDNSKPLAAKRMINEYN